MYSSDPLAALNYSFSLNMPGSDADLFNLVSHFPVHTEQYYLSVQNSQEMINYRLTVTNTSVWSLLVVIHSGLLIRPVPLFPLSIAKTTGIVKVLGDVWGGQIQYIILMMIITNFLTASIICFMVICLFLLQNSLRTMFSRRIGIMMAIFTHLSMTLFVLLFLTFVYTPTNNLKSQLILDYGANRLKGLIDEDTVILATTTPT
uniref:Uncharacterized protein n=1 Tax=Ditylenchus dipsaci TaxID=166011 RepID=A0A915D6E5_9BILA